MDWIRYILIAAIVGVALVLVNQWTAFKKEYEVVYSTQRASQQAATPAAADDTPEVPSETAAEELPSASVNELPSADGENIANAGNSTTVRVTTDVLIVDIDLSGGDIVGVKLPQQLSEMNSKEPFVLLERNAGRTYIAQSGLIGSNGTDTADGRPMYRSSDIAYDLEDNQQELTVDLVTRQNETVEIIKRYTFTRGDHLVQITYLVKNGSELPWNATFYAQLKRDSSVDPAADTTGMGMKPFLGVASRTDEKPYVKTAFKKLADEPMNAKVTGGWIAIVQHYFISAWIPADDEQHHFTTKVTSRGDNLIRFTGPTLNLAPGNSGEIGGQFYAGPKDQYRLKEIASGLELTVDYGWLWWIAQPLFWVMTQIHKIVGNWGWSIIFLTILVKALFFQLSAASYRSMAKMRAVAPKMAQIRETYGDDKQKQSQEMMALYKKEKVNPLGGCLPILIQMPVFIALYWVLMESVELRHAPWLGWIKDLSAMDPYFILPLFMGASMWFQQRLNPPPPDPMQAKIMQWMPVFFTFFFLWFPSGLVLYWVVNNLLSITQQWIITRRIENAASDS